MDKTFEVLKLLSETDEFVSGEALGARLGISRAGVLRHIEKLRAMGYAVESVSRKGHRLLGGSAYSAYSVRLLLNHPMEVTLLDSTGSTNDVAKLAEGREGIVLARTQSAGRGRKARSFASEEGGCYLSYYFQPDRLYRTMRPGEAVRSVLFAGIAEVRMLRGFGIEAQLKWPNDVLVGGRKICGILSEMIASMEEISRIVVGVGTNVNNDPGLPAAVSMRELLGGPRDRNEVAARLADCLHEVFEEFFDKGFEPLRREYVKSSCTVGRRVRVQTEGERFDALALDVNCDGFLVVDRGDGAELVIAGDVTVRDAETEGAC